MKLLTIIFSALLVAGCTGGVSGVVQTNGDTYMVAAEGVLGNSSAGMQLFKAQEQAVSFCKAQNKRVDTVSSNEAPGGFGKVASATVYFRCS